MRHIVIEGGCADGWGSWVPDRRTFKRRVFQRADGTFDIYERETFVGGEVPDPVVYRFVENRATPPSRVLR